MTVTYIGTNATVPPTPGNVRITTEQHVQIFDGTDWVEVGTGIVETILTDGHTLTTGYELFGQCGYWVTVNFTGSWEYRTRINSNIQEWNTTTFGEPAAWGTGRYCGSNSKYYFKHKSDRDWFVMRWSS